MILIRSHGLGNDYLVLHQYSEKMSKKLAQALCDRHQGVGADGILEPIDCDQADFGVRIWNPDGSIAEKSGNGLRIFAQYLVDHRGVSSPLTISVEGETVTCSVEPDNVTVNMGAPTFLPQDIPCQVPLSNNQINIDGTELNVTAVGMGNPHCVVFFAKNTDLDQLEWRSWGAQLESDPRFPNRTNVQFAVVVNPHRIIARIWERGAGETTASGSSACAVAAAAIRHRTAHSPIEVSMPGGSVHVTMNAQGHLVLTGPVEEVGQVHVLNAWIERRIQT